MRSGVCRGEFSWCSGHRCGIPFEGGGRSAHRGAPRGNVEIHHRGTACRARGIDPAVLKDLNANLDVRMVKLSQAGETEESGFLKVYMTAYVSL